MQAPAGDGGSEHGGNCRLAILSPSLARYPPV
jgi:hypothetical protein